MRFHDDIQNMNATNPPPDEKPEEHTNRETTGMETHEHAEQAVQPQPTRKQQQDQGNELEQLKKKCDEYLNGWKRAQADYQNLQKETTEKQHGLRKHVAAEVIQDFLPLVDYFKYAFSHEIPEDFKNANWMKGIKQIQSYLHKIFSDHGITEIKSLGEKFSPHFHESIGEVESEEQSGTIVEEVGSGFLQNGKVMRHAKVKIAK